MSNLPSPLLRTGSSEDTRNGNEIQSPRPMVHLLKKTMSALPASQIRSPQATALLATQSMLVEMTKSSEALSPFITQKIETKDLIRNKKFFKGFKIEKQLSETEEKLLEITLSSAKRHGFDNLLAYLSGIPEEVLRRQVKLKQEAKSILGIEGKTFFEFLGLLNYCKKLANHQAVHGDQVNDILIAGSTIALRVEELFNGGEVKTSKDGTNVRLNGIFGRQGLVKKEEDLKHVDDLMPFLYILNSSIAHKNALPAYFLFFGETPNPVSGKRTDGDKFFLDDNSGPWFNAHLTLMRAENFIDQALGMSLDVVPTINPKETSPGIIVVDAEKQANIIPIVTALYDLENMTLWRVIRTPQGILAQRMEEWLATHINHQIYPNFPLFRRKDVIYNHIERLVAHSSHGNEHLQLRYTTSKKVGCVDGRQDNNKSDIGSLLNFEQLRRLMEDNHTDKISIVFHTDCGYILTAIVLHRIFQTIRATIDPSDHISRGRAILFIDTLMKKPWIKRGEALLQEFLRHLDLTLAKGEERKKMENLLYNLFTDNHGTLRYATSHMFDRGLFYKDNDGFPVMNAYLFVEAALKQHGLSDQIEESFLNMLIVEELVRCDKQAKLDWVKTNSSKIEDKRLDHTVPIVEWMVEDFVTGRYYSVPEKMIKDQTKEEILDRTRRDSKTDFVFDPFFPRSKAGKQAAQVLNSNNNSSSMPPPPTIQSPPKIQKESEPANVPANS